MFELLIAASALSLIIMIFRKQSRIAEQKRPVDWAMAGHEAPKPKPKPKAKAAKIKPAVVKGSQMQTATTTEESRATNNEPLDFYNINKYFRLAETQFARGELDEAEKSFIKVLSYQDTHPETLNKLGIIYIQQNDLRKAELMFNKLIETKTKDPSHYANYGRCLYALGRKDDAIKAYEKAIELDPTKPNRYINIGNMYYENQNYPKALEYFVRAQELDAYNFEYLGTVADVSELVGDQELFYKTLKKMLEIDPYNFEVKRRFDALNKT